MKYIEDNFDLELYDIYIDDGKTGLNFDRDGMTRLEEAVRSGEVDCILVKDLSRYGREATETEIRLRKYISDGIRFISVLDYFDSVEDDINLLIKTKLIYNNEYAESISNNVTNSFRNMQDAGLHVGSSSCYGYKKSSEDKHKLEIDEYPASIVRDIFKMYTHGMPKKTIAHILNEKKILPPMAYKESIGSKYRNCNKKGQNNVWTYSSIHNILCNEMYIGTMVQGKTQREKPRGKAESLSKEYWIRKEKTHEAIIETTVWEKVQKSLHKTQKIHNEKIKDAQYNITMFSGVLLCSSCGATLCKSSKCDDSNQTYSCGTWKNKGNQYCTPHTVRFDVLQFMLLKDLNVMIQTVQEIDKIISENGNVKVKGVVSSLKCDIAVAEKDIEKYEKRLNFLRDDYYDEIERIGSDNPNLLARAKEEYRNNQERYRVEIDNAKERRKYLEEKLEEHNKVFDYSPWIKKLLETKKIEKLDRSIILDMVDKIIVHEDKELEIVYNFSDELDRLFHIGG